MAFLRIPELCQRKSSVFCVRAHTKLYKNIYICIIKASFKISVPRSGLHGISQEEVEREERGREEEEEEGMSEE